MRSQIANDAHCTKLTIIISYATSLWNNCFIKKHPKINIVLTLIKIKKEQKRPKNYAYSLTVFVDYGVMAHNP